MPETRNETGKRTATPARDELTLIDAIALDEGANEVARGETDISLSESSVRVHVIPAREDIVVARAVRSRL